MPSVSLAGWGATVSALANRTAGDAGPVPCPRHGPGRQALSAGPAGSWQR